MILNGNVSPVTLSILCIIFLLVSGASASPAEIEKLLAEGVDMYNSGDRDTALQLFESVVLTDPSWPYGWLWKGTVLADMGRDMEAEDAFKTGRCLLNPDACDDSSSPPLSEVRELFGAERIKYPVDANNGESIVSHHQGSDPGYVVISDPVQLEREGDRFMESGKYDAALQSYLLAEQIDPSNPSYSRKTGDAYRAKGDFHSALDAWNRSLQNETDPGMSDGLRKKRSRAFSTLNMPDKAIQELEGLKFSVMILWCTVIWASYIPNYRTLHMQKNHFKIASRSIRKILTLPWVLLRHGCVRERWRKQKRLLILSQNQLSLRIRRIF
jgi:tetratricopeptide (TPR) repeat protein